MAADNPRSDREYLTTLARGLSVLRAFTRERPEMTLTEVAHATELSPAVARRCLNTLVHLGYAARKGNRFLLTPEVIGFASAFLESMNVEEIARPPLQDVRDRTGDSSSLAVLSGPDVLYLVHVSTNRTVRLAANVGTRFPAYATSLGRAQLAFLPKAQRDAWLEAVELEPLTDRTVATREALDRILAGVREQGFAAVEDELDYGIVSVAVPVRSADGSVIAAINCSTATTRVRAEAMARTRVPVLREAAARIEGELVRHPMLARAIQGPAGA